MVSEEGRRALDFWNGGGPLLAERCGRRRECGMSGRSFDCGRGAAFAQDDGVVEGNADWRVHLKVPQ